GATGGGVRRVARMALAPGQRGAPFDELHARGLDGALAALDEDDQPEDDRTGHDDAGGGDRTAQADRPPERVVPLRAARAPAGPAGRRSPSEGNRGRLIGDRVPNGPVGAAAAGPTAPPLAPRPPVRPG